MFDPFDLSEDEALQLADGTEAPLLLRSALVMHPSPIVAGYVAHKLSLFVDNVLSRSEDPIHLVPWLSLYENRFHALLAYHFDNNALVADAARNRFARDAHLLLEESVVNRILGLLLLRTSPKKFWDRWSVSPKLVLKSLGLRQQAFVLAGWSCDQQSVIRNFLLSHLYRSTKLWRLTKSNVGWGLFRPQGDLHRYKNWHVAAHLDEYSYNRKGWDALVDEVITGAPADATLQSDDAHTLLAKP